MAKKRMIHIPDLSDEDSSGGGGVRIKEGRYRFVIDSLTEAVSKKDNEMLVWTFKGLEGEARNKKIKDYTVLTPGSAGKLKRTLENLGVYEDGEYDIDPDSVEGLEVYLNIQDSAYQTDDGRSGTNSKIQGDIELADEEGEAGTKAAAPASKNGKAATARKGRLPQLETSEVKKSSVDELEELADKYDLGIDLSKKPTLPQKRNAVITALQNAGHLAD